MKKIITLIAALLISQANFAQQGINYKAVIKDDSGNVVAGQPITVQFSILKGAGQTNEYTETHNPTTDANGIIVLTIGGGTQASGNYGTIDWGSDEHWLNVQIDTGSGVIDSTTEFMAVPYALQAESATFKTVNNVTSNTPGNLAEDNLVFGSTQMDDIQGSDDDDTRLFFNKSKGAFRAGGTAGDGHSHRTKWNNDLVGDNSAAFGFSSEASGDGSFAAGALTEAKGNYSVAMGLSSDALGSYSVALGDGSVAEGLSSVAIGSRVRAFSFAEIVVGRNSSHYTPYNGSDGPSTQNWYQTDRLFAIGNGTTFDSHNALTVLKNGNVGIGRSNPTSLLEVAHQDGVPNSANRTNAFSIRNLGSGRSWQFYTHTTGYLELYNDGTHKGSFNPTSGAYATASDRRLKKDITILENGTLNKVMQLNPVSYLMKDQTDTNRNLGLISQEVQEIFPSITHYVEESDLLTLSYTELIPILIKALQEQQAIIETQNSKLTTQDSKIDNLTAKIGQFKTLDLRVKQLENSLKTIAQ